MIYRTIIFIVGATAARALWCQVLSLLKCVWLSFSLLLGCSHERQQSLRARLLVGFGKGKVLCDLHGPARWMGKLRSDRADKVAFVPPGAGMEEFVRY